MTTTSGKPPSRRQILRGSAGIAGTVAALSANPARSQLGIPWIGTSDKQRPGLPSGVQSGDLLPDGAMIWSRSDRPAHMLVEWATNEQFTNAETLEGPLALQDSGFTARIDVRGMPAGADIFYRVRFRDATDINSVSEPLVGRLRTPPADKRDVSFAFSGDETGQGWGIDKARGGYRTYETIRKTAPDFFIHQGDQIYADQPMPETIALPDGTQWRNEMIEVKTRVAESLDDFRGCYAYNLTDENKRRCLTEVPFIGQWDDHDVKNNWFPGQSFSDPRYKSTTSVSLLSAYSRRARFEFNPGRPNFIDPERLYNKFSYGPSLEVFLTDVRSERGPNTKNVQSALDGSSSFLGPRQLAWLKRSLKESRATWKVIAVTLPISIVNVDYNRYVKRGSMEAWANEDNGAPLGRELELADLLSFIKRNDIRNVVWIAADVHFACAIHHDPARAAFSDFLPFWQFVASPIHAGTYDLTGLDLTFGPKIEFKAVSNGMDPNRPPTDGLQFFGHAAIDGKTQAMTVRIINVDGETLFTRHLEPEKT